MTVVAHNHGEAGETAFSGFRLKDDWDFTAKAELEIM